MRVILGIASLLFALYSLSGKRWAYVVFLAIAVSSIPSRTGFHMVSPVCETVVTIQNAIFSLTNYKHILIFAVFFIITVVQFRPLTLRSIVLSMLITIAFGLILELEEGATRTQHCRMRDLVPDTVGALIGMAIALAPRMVRKRRMVAG